MLILIVYGVVTQRNSMKCQEVTKKLRSILKLHIAVIHDKFEFLNTLQQMHCTTLLIPPRRLLWILLYFSMTTTTVLTMTTTGSSGSSCCHCRFYEQFTFVCWKWCRRHMHFKSTTNDYLIVVIAIAFVTHGMPLSTSDRGAHLHGWQWAMMSEMVHFWCIFRL